MVLDEVAQRARSLVVTGASADPEILGGGDLDVVDEVAIPHRLKQRVGEPQRQQVLDCLLAEVVVDPEDLRFVEDLEHVAIELPRGREVVAERLLDHNPGLRLVRTIETGLTELLGDHREELRSGREVEHAVELLARLLVELVQYLGQLRVYVVVVERTRHIADVR